MGLLPAQGLAFSPLGALHPSHLGRNSRAARSARSHRARRIRRVCRPAWPGGYEEALRIGDWNALDWWFARVPELVNRVPATQGNQLDWLPLARVLSPSFMPDPAQQRATVVYLLARGANPWQPLPHAQAQSIVSLARELRSPLLSLLDPPHGATRSRSRRPRRCRWPAPAQYRRPARSAPPPASSHCCCKDTSATARKP